MGDEDLIGLGVNASLAQLYKDGQHEFVEQLAEMLELSLPGETQVDRRGGLFSDKKVKAVRLYLTDFIYSLELPNQGGPITARTKVVRGIKLKTVQIGMDEWLAAISEALGRYAQSNQQARDALWNLVNAHQSIEEETP